MVLMMEGSSMFPMREEKLDWQLIAALDPDTLGKNVLCKNIICGFRCM